MAAAAGAVAVAVLSGGATALDELGAGLAGAALLRGFTVGRAAADAGLGEEVAVGDGEGEGEGEAAGAMAEKLASGEVLPADVALQPEAVTAMTATAAKLAITLPALCSFFIGDPF